MNNKIETNIDLVRRLRALSRLEHSDFTIGDEAADEIVRLTSEVERLQQDMRDAIKILHKD